ncbi:MAG TPA: mechanosensitive ion channel domain-containing protein [Candidatus Bathyarchaeia archaeon]|nr:mechanosensitive ion channel domain-containing protein [Candidatus Bathyarchaeia archaeon]
MSVTPTPTPSQGVLFGIDAGTAVSILIVAVVALVVERLIARYLSRVAKRLKLELHVTNNLVLIFRIIILIFALATIASVGKLQPELLLGLSAIGGAALGFASQKTLGNFLAGLFLLAARPFKVGDYVRLGTVEGIVQEITINYTRVLTIGNNTVSVSNLQILDRDITNFSQGNVYCYTFEVGFDHTLSTEKIAEVFHAVFEKYRPEVPRMPTYMLIRSGGIERIYMVYLYVNKPEDIFKLRPQFSEEVYQLWDLQRLKK